MQGQRDHMYEPRRLFGQQGTDYQERVNFERLRKERLRKLKAEMAGQGYAGLLLSHGHNIRYATGTWDQGWRTMNQTRYCLVPLKSDPILFETIGEDTEVVKRHCPWMRDRIRPAITYIFTEAAFSHQLKRYVEQILGTLKEEGINPKEDKVGYDFIDVAAYEAFKEAGLHLVSGAPAIKGARLIKTPDEIELMKIGCAITDACFYYCKHEWVKPGRKETEVLGKIAEFLWSRGMEQVGEGVIASGDNTNPYHRARTDRLIRQGDMVIIDLAVESYMGYIQDVVRCWPCCARFTEEQKEVYRLCYDSLQAALSALKPGATTADVARGFLEYADDVEKSCSLVQFGHSIGLSNYEGYWISRGFSLDFPMPIKQNMCFAIETYYGKPGGVDGARLEENIVVTEDGYQALSLFPFEEEVVD